ncbi:MAG: cell division protease FtsH [Acidimicrobiaceae bacterium]|nr:cell division protease FtsH [Acidimicrobiaceae bacterium]
MYQGSGGWIVSSGGGPPSAELYQFATAASDGGGAPPARFELGDIRRLGQRLLRAAATSARVKPPVTVAQVLAGHLGAGAPAIPVVGETWPSYEHVNIQVALNRWLARPGRQHSLVGITGFQHRMFSLADLAQPEMAEHGPGVGSVAMTSLPIGPGGATMSCVRCGLYLVTDAVADAVAGAGADAVADAGAGPRVGLLLREGDAHGPQQGLVVEVACADSERSAAILAELRALALAHNVFRGQVLAFGSEMFGGFGPGDAPVTFRERPSVGPESLVLPAGTLELIEQQVIGVARHRDRLLASGQHLKRGLLLYGPPGTGKTHTVRYLLSQLDDVTAVILSGNALVFVGQACSIARALQPALVIIEDVDLIAEERGMHPGQHPLLFQLLNEMDGLGDDVDVTFVLTTNRADLLEPALAARPGRIDEAVELPLPDEGGRLRLLELYKGPMELRLDDAEAVVGRTRGVTASFLKEVLRRAALHAAGGLEEHGPAGSDVGPLTVTDVDVHAALDQLLDERSRITRVLLGGERVGQPSQPWLHGLPPGAGPASGPSPYA